MPKHAIIGEELFTIIQGRGFPSIPPRPLYAIDDIFDKADLPSRFIYDLWWTINDFPFLMAVPVGRPFYGPLFDRLDYEVDRFPVVRRGHETKWSLHPKVIHSWETLEWNTRALLRAMAEQCWDDLPPRFRFWSDPSRYGYRRIYRSPGMVQIVALRSQNAFIPLIAAATFMLMMMDRKEQQNPDFRWRAAVLAHTGLHNQWLSELELSVAGDFNIPRIGGILDFGYCKFYHLLPDLRRLDMPIYQCWGVQRSEPWLPPDYLKQINLVPTSSEIQVLWYYYRETLTSKQKETLDAKFLPYDKASYPALGHSASRPGHVELASRSSASTSNPHVPSRQTSSAHENVNSPDVPATVDAPSFPPVVPYSGQKRGEDWKTFFSRREKANKVSLEAESAVDKQARESRQKHANKQKAPGKKGARVYVWDEIDGHRIRRPAGRQHVDAVWEDYGDQQRRYDAFRDEWDLCSEFGEDDPYYSDDDHEAPLLDFPLPRVGVDQNDDIEMPTRLLPEEPLNLPLGLDRSVYDLQQAHRQEDPEDAPDAYQFSDTAEDRAYYRFGFVNPVAQIAPPVTSRQPTSWNFCREYLGNGRWLGTVSVSSSAAPPPEVQASMCIFFDFLLHSNKIDDIPDEIFDARTQRLDTGLVHLRSERIDGTKYYFLRPKNVPNAPFEVVFTSAPTVVEVLRRQWGLDFFGLVRELLDRGMQFKTCITGTLTQPPAPLTLRFPGLGYRPPNYKPDVTDYDAYQHIRDEFLNSPRGRAALLHGGIVSRLAKHVVHYQHVFDGPTPDVMSSGSLIPGQSVGYWDDALTEHEINVICGVYKVDTDRRASSTQTTDVSWWPKPSAWAAAGFNVGYWSEDCERWFQNHLNKIREGQFQLRSPSAWKNGLRFNQSTAKVVAKNNERAAEYLARYNF